MVSILWLACSASLGSTWPLLSHRVLDGPTGCGDWGCRMIECSFDAMAPDAFWVHSFVRAHAEQDGFRGRSGLLSFV